MPLKHLILNTKSIILTLSLQKRILCFVVFLVFSLSECISIGSKSEDASLIGETLTLTWTYESEGAIDHPPLRVGESIVIAPQNGPLTALDAETGNLNWQFDPPEEIWNRAYTTDGERVIVGVQGGSITALNAKSGKVLWIKDLGINSQVPSRIGSQAIYVPTTFVGPGLDGNPQGRAKLFALDKKNGAVKWIFESENYILQTPFALEDLIFVAGSYFDPTIEVDEGGPMRMYALSIKDGNPQWTYQSEDGFVKAIYATEAMVTYIAYQDFISGVDAQTGSQQWRSDTGNWVPSLMGDDDVVYFGSANTVVHAWNLNTGKSLWTYNIGGESFNYLLGAPVKKGDTLYGLSQRGDIFALDINNGKELWQISTGIRSRVGLTISNGWIYIGDENGKVYAYTSNK